MVFVYIKTPLQEKDSEYKPFFILKRHIETANIVCLFIQFWTFCTLLKFSLFKLALKVWVGNIYSTLYNEFSPSIHLLVLYILPSLTLEPYFECSIFRIGFKGQGWEYIQQSFWVFSLRTILPPGYILPALTNTFFSVSNMVFL